MARWLRVARKRKHTALAVVIGIAVSLVLLWFALRDVSFDQFVAAFDGAHWGWLPVSTALFVAAMYLRAVRWRMLFDHPDKMSTSLSFAGNNIGSLFNNLLPQRAGELTRIVAVHRASGISRVETTATVIAERMIDIFATGVIGLVFVPWLPDTRWVAVVEIVCIVATAAPIVAIALLSGFRSHIPKVAQRLLHKLPRVGHERSHQLAESIESGVHVLTKPHRLPPVLAVSFVGWFVLGLSYWALLQMFDFQLRELPAIALLLVSINFAVALPSAPGAVGVFEAAAQASLVAFGLSPSDALSYAVVAHLITFVTFLVLGGLGMVKVQRMYRRRCQGGGPEAPPGQATGAQRSALAS